MRSTQSQSSPRRPMESPQRRGSGSPLVSVILPAWNAAASLAETLRSVTRQEGVDWECVVVDDGSSDATAEVAEEWAGRHPRIRLIRQHNQGVGAARNTAIRAARGRYIAPLDADDLWEPDKLRRQVEAIERAGDGCGLVYSWSRKIDDRGRRLWDSHPFDVEGWAHEALVMRNFVGNASVPLLRREGIERVGPYLTRDEQGGFQGCEDWDLSLRVLEHYRCALVPDYLVSYRQVDDCMSGDADGMAGSYEFVIERLLDRDTGVSAALLRWSAGHFYSYLVSKAFMRGNHAAVLKYICHSLAADPVMLLDRRLFRFGSRAVAKACLPVRVLRSHRPKRHPTASATPSKPRHGLLDMLEEHRWAVVCGPALTGT